MKHRSCRERGITLVEVLLILCALAIAAVVFFVISNAVRNGGTRPLSDSTQVRGVVQSMVIWAQNNTGNYPLPSAIDLQNQTVSELGESKDTTGNILSLLIFNDLVSAEILVSPKESNTAQVREMTTYQHTNPAAAINPAKALWDPSFRGTPIDAHLYGSKPGISNNSYAHAMTIGNRENAWRDTYSSDEAVFGNRGPTYAKDDVAEYPTSGRWLLLPGPLGTSSNTLLIHGPRTTWEGNIGYNDGRVQFETKPNPDSLTYSRAVGTGKTASTIASTDNLFVNESDEAEDLLKGSGPDYAPWMFDRATNAYLRPIADRSAVWPVTVWRD